MSDQKITRVTDNMNISLTFRKPLLLIAAINAERPIAPSTVMSLSRFLDRLELLAASLAIRRILEVFSINLDIFR